MQAESIRISVDSVATTVYCEHMTDETDTTDETTASPQTKVRAVPRTDSFTANQLVAYNLTKAREMRGWTQEEAAEKMEPFIGERWSKNKFSTAERSIAGKRISHFTADDLDAFSKTFQVPVGFFFLPPAKGSFDGDYANSTMSFEYWVGRSIAPHPAEVRATFDELQKRITGDDRKERRQILLRTLLEHTLACVHLLVDIRSSSSRADGIFANISGQGAKAIEAVLRLGGSDPEDPMADYTRAEWLE